MAIAPPDLAAKAIFDLEVPSEIANQLILKSYDDPQCNTLRLAIFWVRSQFDQQRFGYDVSHAAWYHDADACIAGIRQWIAGVIAEVTKVVLPVGLEKWTTDAPAPTKVKTRPAAGTKQPPQRAPAPTPAPLPVPGERHIEIE